MGLDTIDTFSRAFEHPSNFAPEGDKSPYERQGDDANDQGPYSTAVPARSSITRRFNAAFMFTMDLPLFGLGTSREASGVHCLPPERRRLGSVKCHYELNWGT